MCKWLPQFGQKKYPSDMKTFTDLALVEWMPGQSVARTASYGSSHDLG